MISAFASTWKVPELRERILFTLAVIVIIRLGVHISLPGVDASVITQYLAEKQRSGGDSGPGAAIGAMLGVFSGGGLQKMGIFALGIMPYISASIMMQLMTAVVPKLAKLAREDGGREKINSYTRYATILISLVQGYMLTIALKNPGSIPGLSGIGTIVPHFNTIFVFTSILTIVTGTLLLMWLGDQITEKGLGNGISLIITVNIISALPGALVIAWKALITGSAGPAASAFLVFLVAFLIFVVAAVVAITEGQRRIVIQYAKRVSGRRQLTGQRQYLPLKVNYAGVMPIIFATAILSLPAFVLRSIAHNASWSISIQSVLAGGSWSYYLIAGLMIFFFSYFWVSMMFNPSEISENLKRNGGYIPGIRAGKPTSQFLDTTMTRLTFAGAIFLTIIFILPWVVSQMPRGIIGKELPFMVTSFFGGTSLLILVGVLLDMMRQIETHLIQRNYDGFLRKGKLRSRYDRIQNTGQRASSNTLVYLWIFVAILIIAASIYWMIR